jgi:hypothetical protein
VPVKQGLDNYQLIQDGTRNRWGDYMGIGLDPTDGFSFWSVAEYAVSSGSWGTWIAKSQMAPVAGKAIATASTDLSFPEAEINHVGDTVTVTFTNNGIDSLVISGITPPDSNFSLVDPPTFPFSVGTFDVESLKVRFNPKTIGALTSSFTINSNDTYNPALPISVAGTGFHIIPAQAGLIYGGTGINDYGRLITLDPHTAAGTAVGLSGFDAISSLKINPTTGELWGLVELGSFTKVLRVNSDGGDAHTFLSIPYTSIQAMAFRGDTMYLGRLNGTILRLDLSTGDIVQVASTGLKLDGMDFNPVTGQLWASIQISSPPDRIYKIDLDGGGTPTLVGRTNLGVETPDIAFDGAGNLFGVIGIGPQPSYLFLIDTLTGSGTVIGDVGIHPVEGLAIDPGVMLPVHSFRFAGDWNLFSVPVQLPSYATNSLFPDALSKAFAFQGHYVERDSVNPGYGFWLRFDATSVKSVIGEAITEDSVEIGPAWNLIGSVSSAVPTAGIVTNPPGLISSAFYTYDGGGYVPLDSLLPGYGHWVKSTGAGTLLMESPFNLPRTSPTGLTSVERGPVAPAVSGAVRTLHSLTVSDAAGHAQELLFGESERTTANPLLYELPPPSPDGFDARFASNRMVELYPASLPHAMEFPLKVQSLSKSVTLAWDIASDGPLHYALVYTDPNTGATTLSEIQEEGSVTLPIERASGTRLRVYERLIPDGYALLQNYPNPFNPATTIRYELPDNGYVRLAVYDILGKKIATLVEGPQEAGYYAVTFDASRLASGIYFYQLNAGQYSGVQKMTVMK